MVVFVCIEWCCRYYSPLRQSKEEIKALKASIWETEAGRFLNSRSLVSFLEFQIISFSDTAHTLSAYKPCTRPKV